MTTRIITRHLLIEGRVQRVWFRASMAAEATRLDVVGWVRNRSDGRVEALVQGRPADVERLIAWAHDGPPRARVTRVLVADGTPGAFADFQQRETA